MLRMLPLGLFAAVALVVGAFLTALGIGVTDTTSPPMCLKVLMGAPGAPVDRQA